MNSDIYEKIDEVLKEKRMSRRQLAIEAGIPEATLSSAFARRSKNFSINRLEKIADVLGVPLSRFVPGIRSMQLPLPAEDEPREHTAVDEGGKLYLDILQAIKELSLENEHKSSYLQDAFNSLNKAGQDKLLDYASDLLCIEKYTRESVNTESTTATS